MAYEPEKAVDVLRAVRAADERSADELGEECGPTKSCKNMNEISFDGMAEPGSDLTEAWKDRLRREGKLADSGGTLRDLVLGPSETR
jgi:hypothetical protein